jgi:hypothetical protein
MPLMNVSRQPRRAHATLDWRRPFEGTRGGVLVALMKFAGYRFLVVDHSIEITEDSAPPRSRWSARHPSA